MLAVYGLYRSVCRYRLGGEEGEVYDFEWGSGPGLLRELGVGWGIGACWGDAGACWDNTGAVCGEVDSHVQPRS